MFYDTKKYLYDDFFDELRNNNENTCLITEIRDVDRCNYESFNKLYDSLKPLTSFVLYNDDAISYVNGDVRFYLNDNRGNSKFIGEIIKYLDREGNSIETIVIDASAVNKETLLELIFVVRNIVSVKATIDIIYTTPSEYGDYSFENYKLPYSLSFSPGRQLMGNKTVLILISGYEENGELALIRHIDPEHLLIGSAEPSTEEPFIKQNAENIKKVIKEFSKDEGIKIEEFNCVGNDIGKCYEDLEKLLEENKLLKDSNVFIAPMNNKLTTIASYLIWEKYPDIQILSISGDRRSDAIKESGKSHIYKTKIKEIG